MDLAKCGKELQTQLEVCESFVGSKPEDRPRRGTNSLKTVNSLSFWALSRGRSWIQQPRWVCEARGLMAAKKETVPVKEGTASKNCHINEDCTKPIVHAYELSSWIDQQEVSQQRWSSIKSHFFVFQINPRKGSHVNGICDTHFNKRHELFVWGDIR